MIKLGVIVWGARALRIIQKARSSEQYLLLATRLLISLSCSALPMHRLHWMKKDWVDSTLSATMKIEQNQDISHPKAHFEHSHDELACLLTYPPSSKLPYILARCVSAQPTNQSIHTYRPSTVPFNREYYQPNAFSVLHTAKSCNLGYMAVLSFVVR